MGSRWCVFLLSAGLLMGQSCGDGDGGAEGNDARTVEDDAASSPDETADGVENDTPTVTWSETGFAVAVGGDVQHVTELLLMNGGETVWAGYYDSASQAHLATSDDGGASWTHEPVPGLVQIRVLLELADGTVLMGGSGRNTEPRLMFLAPGSERWQPCGQPQAGVVLPTETAENVWDVVLADDGTLYIATDSLSNDPGALNETVLRSTDNCWTLEPTAPLPGLGVLALASSDGNLYAANEESNEHDDPDLAGQAHVFVSDDGGDSWRETGALDGANRVYRMIAMSDGTLLAGSGIRGELYRSVDQGRTWLRTTHVPAGTKLFGDPPVETEYEASRVYSILELQEGLVLVGTGNATGDLYLTADVGDTWHDTGETRNSIVCWALAQADDGTIWIGTGSHGGDVWRGRVTWQ